VSSRIGTNGGHHPLDDLAAYALGALDDSERQAVDDHLASCLTCRAELAGHQETLAALTPDEAPPAAVWERIAVSIGAPGLPDPHTGGPAPSSRAVSDLPVPARPSSAGAGDDTEPEHETDHAVDAIPAIPSLAEARARTRRPPRLGLVAAAASLLALVTGGAFGYALGNSNDNDDSGGISALAEQASEAPGGVLGTLADTGGQPVGQVVADEDGAFVVLEGLQDLPEGRAYQLWSLSGPQPVSLGMLGRDGSNTVAFRLPPTITELAISVEPTRGETSPSGEFQASGSLSQST
jgi:anti-sigma-K factor RskA